MGALPNSHVSPAAGFAGGITTGTAISGATTTGITAGAGTAGATVAREGAHVVEMQRRRLLLAMQELAGQDGLESVTVGRVCKRSRVSRRTFYEQFDDREDCFLAAFELAIERCAECVLPAYRAPGRWRERIRGALGSLLALFEEQPQLARLCVVETLKGSRAVLVRRRETLDVLALAVEEGRSETRARASGPPALTAESTVGGVLAVLHARLLASGGHAAPASAGGARAPDSRPKLTELIAPLTGMIVHPYLGAAASQRETERQSPPTNAAGPSTPATDQAGQPTGDPFRDLSLRFTYRTALVLATIAANPGASNRQVGASAGVPDQGQISKLLRRLQRAGLIENAGGGRENGEPNAWKLTPRGHAVEAALGAERVEA